jgi:hypothetical protein
MGSKNIYIILLLILVIIISQIFAIILSISRIPLIEGIETSDCLPDCANVEYDYNTNTIPPCKGINVKVLKKTDATTLGLPIINNFISNINTYLNTQYNFDISINKILNNTNPSKIEINKYFTDFSGMNYHSNQDILDNMAIDQNFNSNINNFTYANPSIDIINNITNQKMIYPIQNTKNDIINIINTYNSDIANTPQALITIYTNFLQDISGMCISLQNKCTKYYTDQNLLSIVKTELEEPTYNGLSSSFHKVSDYIFKAINGTLGT